MSSKRGFRVARRIVEKESVNAIPLSHIESRPAMTQRRETKIETP
jgi:hypothetical protein